MTPELARAARELLIGKDGTVGSTGAADSAVRAFQQLTVHLARIVGTNGIMTVLKRSIALSVPAFPWLAAARTTSMHESSGDLFDSLRAALEPQSPDVIGAMFESVLSTFVSVLERLIGDTLVWRLVEEVWPAIFVHVKETP